MTLDDTDLIAIGIVMTILVLLYIVWQMGRDNARWPGMWR